MTNIIEKLLCNEKHQLVEDGKKKVLFREYYPENCVEIEGPTSDGKYIILEVHRDERWVKVETEKVEEAAFYAVILYKRVCGDRVIDREEEEKLDNYMELGKSQHVLDYIIKKFDASIYSIDCVEYLKISLIRSRNVVDVMFAGEYVVKDKEIRLGYVVFYNYCTLLNYIKSICDEIEKEYNYIICREKAYRLYVLKK